jgi:lipid II isoglutaminyl synthase (glutamine-hydrolysing)
MKLTLYHFFDELLNLYGDRGNVMALKKRCEMRGIELEVVNIKSVEGLKLSEGDIYFIGGGADSSQALCTEQLLKVKKEFKDAIEDGVSALTICGGYQFLGQRYVTASGEDLETLGLLDFYTEASKEEPRLIGNILLDSSKFGKLVGYENHGGRTYHEYEGLGEVVRGFGNNGVDKKEGLVYKNLIGTYLHGPILPKNPTVADFLISNAMERKYGAGDLVQLEDIFENKAKNSVWDMCIK